ncbi:4-hydroxyphenylpyruvate dioxygenase family protein [Nodosilinea sp. E11]|uniref:4-hydroxyphenylpyruvate dioxygenase family protein n=1 Tax=Nodosilinea sp. E11 TaxID=3037479 RepID=UPI0029342A2B|nr:VOC family protein [Nodosilinea sp. E11]WOD38139.1 VOC family protein [Nodosilinea sp. E11]
MEFNHLSFYVDAVAPWRDWFVNAWGGVLVTPTASDTSAPTPTDQALVLVGQVPLLLLANHPVVASYLSQHPAGIGDVALRVRDLDQTLARVVAAGGTVAQPSQADAWGRGRWAQIQGWGSLRHTLVESWQTAVWVPAIAPSLLPTASPMVSTISAIDHAVVNVPAGELSQAVDWYQRQLGFCPQQQFVIDTPRSGLRSQVLAHPEGNAQLPINEPATANSQVQEFLNFNQGSGIQHVALHTDDIVCTVEHLRAGGVSFLSVPPSYYEALRQRPGYWLTGDTPSSWLRQREAAIAQLQILVDWDPHLPQARLLQTFTQPFLNIPTVFFELIQRQVVWANGDETRAQGFGERNFQALFEAIEREQMKRGSLA